MGTVTIRFEMIKYAAFALFGLAHSAAILKGDTPTCAAPSDSKVEWVGCGVDNAWYGVSKSSHYTHFSAEFTLCAELGGHVAWMNEEEEDSCSAQALVQTNTVNEYVVLSGDYHEDVGEWMWPHLHVMTYYDWYPGSTSTGNCMGAYYDGTTYGWIQQDCMIKTKAMCRVDC